MNETAPQAPVPRSAVTGDSDFCAVLVIDSTGRVVATNESARQLWAAPNRTLIGTPVGGMLLTESSAADAIPTDLTWKTFSTAALNQWTLFVAKPQSGAPRAVRVRLERAVGGAGSYIAVVAPR